ncbi:ECF-type sigma factor [Rivibacter subsaxonicus]|uniref:RNA polymerase ECF family sigma subunit n=1 Tax=Rivibacter subsaxonicus TaxID=457575 RepID=A0A4V2FTH8_9BURK|nr:ECF-type sigma factor [Rivibacter subsaxonicus]RZT98005.1 RNA polymerase ECF family sigma subunit [Rivibacter subsaxonicus]
MGTSTPPITQLLRLAADGDRVALDAIYEALYPQLRRVAHARLYAQGSAEDMGTTTLVHESFLRLVSASQLQLEDRKHFFTYAAKTMRNIIVDDARAIGAQRRGGDLDRVTLDGDDALPPAAQTADTQALDVHEALAGLEAIDADLAELVEMRFFGGYDEAEIAELLGISERTVRRRWDKARSFLYLALREGGG